MEEKYAPNVGEVVITVHSVEGVCTAGMKVGDKIVLRGPRIKMAETDNLCMNALAALSPYIRQWGSKPAAPTARPYVCCPDPGPGKGGMGHVIFHLQGRED